MKRIIWATVAMAAGSPAVAAPLPDAVRAMIEAALASDEPQTIAAVVAIARRTNPESAAEIDAMTADHDRELAAKAKANADAERERLASAGLFSLWTGQFELGGSWSTGNSRTLGLYGGAKLKRSGLDWQHDMSLRIDYQETDGQPTTERAVAAWQPRYKISPSYYAFGLTQYEHDRFLGYEHRLTAGLGLGVVAVNTPRMRLEFDAGPAFRYTSFYDGGPDEQRIAGRGGLNLKWTPWTRVTLAQELAVYVQKDNTTAASTTSIETLLFGPLKGRLSYNVQYERDAPPDQKRTDTVSRASLVYSF
ncbi:MULTISPECIES: DUF481 domain-containing protein [unclassified Sphingomonas]|nr:MULTISPECIES: DUF481 domain-containing protein [unclassified Sphingomonas]KQX18198.1 hypothetical protein ASD17_18725 [Sphingomonas sp. Root1294]KQY71003.1 hypothetical protein ASD39_22625 [Sphingomonas sp. Root50]KRB92187.1 hypothetical protein ASE22_07685 [Sphingomonas sp. Root720]